MFGGSAAFFGSVTWQNRKAVESSASHWSGYGRRNSGRVSGAMVAGLSGAREEKLRRPEAPLVPNSRSQS